MQHLQATGTAAHVRIERAAPPVNEFDRLATLRLPLILLVVLYHNETGGQFISRMGDSAAAGVIDWIAHGLAGIRVPVFFVIAGYVFFLNGKPSVAWFRHKIASRARSLLLPLVLWTTICLGAFAVAQQIPALRGLFNGASIWSQPVLGMGPVELFNSFFGQPYEMFLYPLWFLRDLFVLALLSPVIYWLVSASRGWITAVVFLAWVAGPLNPLVTQDALFFFMLGCHLAIFGKTTAFADPLGLAAIAGGFNRSTQQMR